MASNRDRKKRCHNGWPYLKEIFLDVCTFSASLRAQLFPATGDAGVARTREFTYEPGPLEIPRSGRLGDRTSPWEQSYSSPRRASFRGLWASAL